MKSAIALWLLVAGVSYAAPLIDEPVAELRLKNNTVYRDALAKTYGPTTVFIKHVDGGASIPYDEFPDVYKATLDLKRLGPKTDSALARAKANVTASDAAQSNSEESATSGPFGLAMGMKLEAVGSGVKKVRETLYDVAQVPVPHSRFTSYRCVVTPMQGLAKIIAYTAESQTSTYGDNLRFQYESIVESVSKKYGRPKRIEYLKTGSIWDEPRDWMTGLAKDERTHCAIWPATDGGKLPNNLQAIIVQVVASDRESGRIRLCYEFKNLDAAIAESKAAEDESL